MDLDKIVIDYGIVTEKEEDQYRFGRHLQLLVFEQTV